MSANANLGLYPWPPPLHNTVPTSPTPPGCQGGARRPELADLKLTPCPTTRPEHRPATPNAPAPFCEASTLRRRLAAAKASMYLAIREAAINPTAAMASRLGLAAHSALGSACVADAHGDQNTSQGGDPNLMAREHQRLHRPGQSFRRYGTWQEGDEPRRALSVSATSSTSPAPRRIVRRRPPPTSSSDALTLANFIQTPSAVIGSAVPEPGTLSLLTLSACGLMLRRRRK
jgi:hypothetical protein